jgi:hypothetical protein
LGDWPTLKKYRFSSRDVPFSLPAVSAIGDKNEIDEAKWLKPRGIRFTPFSHYVSDKPLPRGR